MSKHRLSIGLACLALALGASAGALALSLPNPGDLLAISQGSGQQVQTTALVTDTTPADVATPRAACGPGSHPLDGYVDGRVPAAAVNSPAAAQGWTCNLTAIAHQGTSGGFKVWAYQDPHGHLCAYYDTTLLFPLNAVNIAQVKPSLGVAVLDMTDPAHPVQTATLTTVAMLSPHESLSLNAPRGLLAADSGNPLTEPGDVSIYSLSQDCRHPVLDFDGVIARFGHEGAFSPDGRTFWSTSSSTQSITAIDVADPNHPHPIYQGKLVVHGLSFSDDGNIAYMQMPLAGELDVFDVSQVQGRVPHPAIRELARLTWPEATIPQSSAPMTINGHRYLLEFDEYAFRIGRSAPPDTVGAGRIIDVADPAHPRVVANLRLAVNQPAAHRAAANDPGALSPVQGYAAHYCAIPREVNPEIVACSFINSGLRVFDIRDPLHPREVAYYISPPKPADENGAQPSDFAMSRPAFDPARREVWYTDGTTGFYVLKLAASVWPDPLPAPAAHACAPAGGRLSGRTLGRLRIGARRHAVRRAYGRPRSSGPGSLERYCLSGGDVWAGYPSPALLRSLPGSQRRRFRNRVILALTANRFYALRGVRPGSSLAPARRRLRLAHPLRIGRDEWFVVPGAAASGVLLARDGTVVEVGLAARPLTSTAQAARRFFRSFEG